MTEATANRSFIHAAQKLGWKCQRHEDKLCRGIPDISYISTYCTGWVEMKFTRGDAKIKVRPAQVNWLCDRAHLPAFRGYIVCQTDDTWLAARVHPADRMVLHDGVKPSTFTELTETTEGEIERILCFIQNP